MLDRLFVAVNRLRRVCPSLAILAIQWLSVKHPIHPVQERFVQLMRNGKLWTRGEFLGRRVCDPAIGPRPMAVGPSGLRQRAGGRDVAPRGAWSWVPRALPVGLHHARLALILVCQGARVAVYGVLLSGVVLWLRWRFRRLRSLYGRRLFHVVAKTWCFGTWRPSDGLDFYYGDLPRILHRRGVQTLLVCGDARGVLREFYRWRPDTPVSGDDEPAALPELCLVPGLGPWWMTWQQLRAAWQLFWIGWRIRQPLLKALYAQASVDVLARQTTDNGLAFLVAEAAVRQWHSRVFMTPYEGNSWERCAWWGAKTADPCCQTVGYQHAMLSPTALALRRPFVDVRARSVPDVVLCLGETTAEPLRASHGPYQVQVVAFGSFRRQGERAQHVADPARRTVLVLPEGIPGEVKLLFDAATRAAAMAPQTRFIFRCHPVTPFETMLPRLAEDPTRLANVELSRRPLADEDYARSSLVLYRGSSSVFYAVLRGLRPVYLNQLGGGNVDPLNEVSRWRASVDTPAQLRQLLEAEILLSLETADETWRRVADYVEAYAQPVDASAAQRFLAAVGMAPEAPSSWAHNAMTAREECVTTRR